MKKNADQGFGAGGMVVLAAALAFLLATGIPSVLPGRIISPGEWLAFSGSIFTGLVAILAAAAAWTAVQRQIRVQRDQSMLDLLVREEERLEATLAGLEELMAIIDRIADAMSLTIKDGRLKRVSALGFSSAAIEIERQLRQATQPRPPNDVIKDIAISIGYVMEAHERVGREIYQHGSVSAIMQRETRLKEEVDQLLKSRERLALLSRAISEHALPLYRLRIADTLRDARLPVLMRGGF